jgi:S-DNA-T family DNA segregation ATPase FtsK/SpoIIIE
MVPVVTEAKKAASVLNWSVQEMEKRYAKFAEHNVRNMESYNKKFPEDKMPAIVIIIDELADLMMVAPHDVEDAICRLAQKARAAGIHMVLATQRPSVDVITGIIKANIPSRISFAVSSQIDSRTILDRSGAENLLGRGDMLFFPVGASKPVRVQGAFVSDEEVERLIDCIKAQGQEMETNEEIVAFTEKEMAAKEDEGKGKKGGKRKPSVDEKLPDVVDFIMGGGGASASAIQRRFRIGYNHAARLVETLEDMHIVGPSNGSKPREVTMSEEQAAQVIAQAMAEDAAG